MFQPEFLEDFISEIKVDDFYVPFHRDFFDAVLRVHEKKGVITEELLKLQLEENDKFKEEEFFSVFLEQPVTKLDFYVKELKNKSTKRRLLSVAKEIEDAIFEQDTDSIELLNFVESEIFAIGQDSATGGFKNTPEILEITKAYIEEMRNRENKTLTGVDTGFTSLNKMTTGLNAGDLVILAARPAMGKCLSLGTNVIKYDGSVEKVENIREGDLLMGDDSTPRKVLSLARGREKMYWIRQNKGIDYRVNESHILSLKRSRNEGRHKNGDVLNISVKEYIQKSDKFKSNYKGYKVAVEFEEKPITVEPYFLGVWLGDGSSSSVTVTNTDKEVVQFLYSYAERLNLQVHKYKGKNRTANFSITNGKKGSNNFSLQAQLRDLNLLNNKHIPQNYLTNSTEIRLQLLAGLIDSDGHYDRQANGYEITQKSESLAKQIKLLCDSLGFRTSLKSKKAKIKSIGYEGTVHRVRFFGDIDKIPVKIERKKARAWGINRTWNQTGIRVEEDIVDDYYGFTLDGNNLFLLEDMTVTHNTAFSLNIVYQSLQNGDGVAFFSLEMPVEQLMLRLLSIDSLVELQKLRTGDLKNSELARLNEAMKKFANYKLFIDDDGGVNIHQLRTKLRKLKAKNPELGLAVIDYIQIMSSSGSKDRQAEVSEISRGLKLLARELKIPILALSQLNRSLESRNDKRPIMSDIRESGCLTGDSLITNGVTGKRYRIDDIVENRDKLLPFKTKAMSDNLKIDNFSITNAFFSGVKKVYQLTTKSGKVIKATANHKFYRVDGWFPLEELRVGDKIATPENMNSVGDKTLQDDEVILLAHLLGDGSILPNQPYHYTSQDMENIEIVQQTVRRLFNIEGNIIQQKSWWHIYLKSPYHLTHNVKNPITLWFEKLGIDRVRSYDKEIPEIVFQLLEKQIALFLHHLWATDGSITRQKGKNNRSDKIQIYYASTSYVLSKQVQSLLLKLGIISTIRKNRQTKKGKEFRPIFHTSIQGKENLEKFLLKINSFGKRGEPKDEYLQILAQIKANPNNGVIDKIVWTTTIKEAKDRAGISWRDFANKLNMSYAGSTLFKHGISKNRMKRVAKFLSDKDLDNLANSNIYWDDISSIEELGEEKTYDLTVDSVHNFVANDIVVHNSIEQDADIIMFVYRDDVYRLKAEKEKEKEAQAKGEKYVSQAEEKSEELAEIIIGKQRNGPTGVVKLNFIKHQTRFVDFADEHHTIDEEVQQATRSNLDSLNNDVDMPPI
jgi:replicative DNA helicase